MKVLKEGKAHTRMAWFHTCEVCDSELRIIEGDPQAGSTCYNCDASQYYIRYICPVCRSKNIAFTASSFGKKANAEYKKITLNMEDRDEIDNWVTPMYIFNDEKAMAFLSDRSRV